MKKLFLLLTLAVILLDSMAFPLVYKDIWQLTKNSYRNIEPAWTPDGRKIIYSSNMSGNFELYKIDSNGFNTPEKLTDTFSTEAEPHVSPDGTQIVYTYYYKEKSDIWLTNINGTSSIKLIESPETDCNPKFSPDGKKIAFCSYRDTGTPAIWIYNIETQNTAILTGSTNERMPAWSPDGARIAYISAGDNNLYTVKTDGSDTQKISSDGLAYTNPSYSPDGKYIIVSGVNPGTSRMTIYLFSSATPDQKWEIVDTSVNNYFFPRFSPSGSQMLFYYTSNVLGGIFNIGKAMTSFVFREYPQNSTTSVSRITSYPKEQTLFILENENESNWKLVRSSMTPPVVTTDILSSSNRIETIITGSDGMKISYIKDSDLGRAMYMRNLATGIDTKLTTTDRYLIGGVVQGANHYYATLNGGGSKIYRTSLEGSAPELIWQATNLYASLIDINSSQRQNELMIALQEGEYQDIYILSTDGNTQKNLNNDKHIDFQPSSSHDGNMIAFISGRHGSFSVWLMSAADGSNLTKITQSDCDDLYPSFLSDGELVFIRNDFSNKAIIVLPLKKIETIRNEFFQGSKADLQIMINSRYMHDRNMMMENLNRFFK